MISKEVYVLPVEAKSNQYYENLLRIIRDCGYSVASIDHFMKSKRGGEKRKQIFMLSWQEDSVAKDGLLRATRQFIYLLWVLMRVFFYRGKLIWIKHNYKPHKLNSATFIAKYYYRIIRALLNQLSSLKIAHSRAFCKQNPDFQFIPHPSYITGVNNSIRDKDFFLFGKIMRYKNIPRLLSTWPNDVSLDICGVAEDEELAHEIASEILRRNLQVNFQNGFIDNSELDNKLSSTKIVICPNAEDSMIVSGVIIHALSAGCAVLARKSEFADELHKEGFPIWQFSSEVEIPTFADVISRELASNPGISYLEKYSDMQVRGCIRELFKEL